MATKISSGGFGSIFKVSIDNTFAALKVVPHKHGIPCNLLELILYFNKCQNIIQAYEYEIDSSCYKILMPIALYDLSKIKKISRYFNIKDILFDIVKGIDYLHSRKIAHGDIKPSNILIFKENRRYVAKITDFSLSRVCKGEVKGLAYTIGYRPPEVETNKVYTLKSDIWALGQTFKVLQERFDVLRTEEFNDLIKNMCCTNVEKRLSIRDVAESRFFKGFEYPSLKSYIRQDIQPDIELSLYEGEVDFTCIKSLIEYFRLNIF